MCFTGLLKTHDLYPHLSVPACFLHGACSSFRDVPTLTVSHQFISYKIHYLKNHAFIVGVHWFLMVEIYGNSGGRYVVAKW